MTHERSKRLLAALVAIVVTVSMTVPFAGAVVAGQQAGQDSIDGSIGIVQQANTGQYALQSGTTGLNEQSVRSDRPGATIDPALKKADGTVVVVVRLQEANIAFAANRKATIQTLKSHAERTQRRVLVYAKKHPQGVTVLNQFWLTNAVLLRVDTDKISLKQLARIRGVTKLHANFEITIPKPADTHNLEATIPDSPVVRKKARASDTDYNTTYGLEQINATDVWAAYGTQGDGVFVAVLDTGLAIDHPDITLYTEDPGNETYPGGWAEFNSQGEIVPGSVPHAAGPHGTHTSGIVSGSNASGEWIGVAPEVNLMHGLVLPGGTGTFAQVVGGMQWAVAEEADVISMSLGATGYYPAMIDPVLNAHAAGTIVVASVGNSYEGSSGSPGNVYDAVAVGATDRQLDVPAFSSGEIIDTSAAWGDAAPAYWPDTYVVPDVVAPGVEVKSSVPGGGYAQYSGTSMSAPHVAGTIALMLSAAGGDLTIPEIKNALYETAWKPENCNPSCDPREGNDTRYGTGIIDAKAAVDLVAADQGIVGTVTDANGTPIAGATVTIDTGFSAETNASGMYALRTQPGTYTLTVSEFGYETETATVTVENGTFTTQNFTLAESVAVRVTEDQPSAVEAGGNVSVVVEVANLDTYTAELVGNYSAADATLFVNGVEYDFGEPISFDDYSGEVTVTVATAPDTSGEFSLQHTFEGAGETIEVTTGPTTVFAEFTRVAVVDSEENFGDQVVAVLREELPAQYNVTLVPDQNALAAVGEYDVFVVQDVDPSELDVQAFVEATDTPQIGVVWLDQWSTYSDGIPVLSDATGNPASTAEDGFGAGNPYFVIREDHPIFDGVGEVGDRVTIHTGTFGDHTWFSGYRGTVIADVGDNDGIKGSAIAVDRATATVLASSLGRQFFVTNEDFTEEADQILANSVVFVSEAPPVGLVSGQPRHIEPGEEVTLKFTVSNLKTVRVELAESSTLTEEDLSLYIDGVGPIPFGLTILERPPVTSENYTITVTTDENAVGSFSLVSTFSAGENCRLFAANTRKLTASGEQVTVLSENTVSTNKLCDEITVRTGPTAVYTAPLNVPGEVETLQAAVDLVVPGGTIVVAEGTYTETVTVDTKNVTIRAAEGATPVVTAPANDTGESVMNITADSVTVNGLGIDAAGTNTGIEINGAANTTLSGVTVWNANTGIWSNGVGTVITESTVTATATGIVLSAADDSRIESTTVRDAATGIVLESSADSRIENASVTNATTGIVLESSDGVTIGNSTVTNSTTAIDIRDLADHDRIVGNEIDNAETGIRIAGNEVVVRLNDVNAQTGVLLTESVGPSVSLRYNDLAATAVAVNNTGSAVVDARLNYYGPRGPVNTAVEGNVVYDPFLTAPPEEVDTEETTAIATDLTMEAGDAYALGIPGPTEQTVGDIFGEFEGVVYGYNADTQSWEELTARDEVGALDALYVVAESDARAVVTFQSTGPVPPVPGQKRLVEGWNFVAAPKYAPIEEAFAVSSADLALAMTPFTQPASQLGPPGELDGSYTFGTSQTGPNVSAFTGYYLFAESSGLLPSYLQANPTMEELYTSLGVPITVTGQSSSELLTAQTVDFTTSAHKAQAKTGDAPPLPPAAYYGTVLIDGQPAPAGTTVTVTVDGETRAQTTTDARGTFGTADVFGEKLLVRGSLADVGKPVEFFVNGQPADVTLTWQPGNVQTVTLSVAADATDDDKNKRKKKDKKKNGKEKKGLTAY